MQEINSGRISQEGLGREMETYGLGEFHFDAALTRIIEAPDIADLDHKGDRSHEREAAHR
jgi:hypothetical protein